MKSKEKIDGTEITNDTLTGRAGLSLFVRYLDGIGIAEHLENLFGGIRKSRKGCGVVEILKQVFCFLLDGTSRHLTYFDELRRDAGYAATIESRPEQLQSSHAIKRFFKAFTMPRVFSYRGLLQKLFVWRLRLLQPSVIELGIDTMVMDNDEAEQRHGVKPTYKKVKGFQPLQMNWGRFIVDAVFRGGNRHSNYSDHVEKMVAHVVKQIRRGYRADVPIIVRLDSGFFDEKLMKVFEELGIGYVMGGRLLSDLKKQVGQWPAEGWSKYDDGKAEWEYVEIGDRRRCWERFRRAVFMRCVRERNGQGILDFARPDTVIYTNLGLGGPIDDALRAAGHGDRIAAEAIIRTYHQRGADELVNKAFKEFRDQRLPFKRFRPNAAFYYTALVAFFLFECFKEDVAPPVVGIASYANAVRRNVIDVAGKIVRTAGRVILKVTRATWEYLGWPELWARSGAPPPFEWR